METEPAKSDNGSAPRSAEPPSRTSEAGFKAQGGNGSRTGHTPPPLGHLERTALAALARSKQAVNDGDLEKTIAIYDEVLALKPNNVEALVNKGALLRRLGKKEAAIACFWRAVEFAGDRTELWVNTTNALIDLGRLEEAQATIATALRRDPNSSGAWDALGTLLSRRGHHNVAEIALRRALALAPKQPLVMLKLAEIVARHDRRLDLACDIYENARRLAPELAAAHSGYGQVLISLGQLDEAESYLRRALEIDKDHLDAHLGMARQFLLKGDLQSGWIEYEWRRKKADNKLPKMIAPEWDGSSLEGKTLLVYAEQGFGDIIQFVRLIPQLAERGARVLLAVPEALEKLLNDFPGTAQVATRFRSLGGFHLHAPLLTLPLRLGITLDNIPAFSPYIKPPEPVTPLPISVGTKVRVGLVWAGRPTHGKDRDRSISLDKLLPIAGIPGVELYSLQVGPRARDLGKYGHQGLIRDLSDRLKDFVDTAGVISQLDLVIAVDTSVAHLAGAMGKPVWVMLPYAPDWRWVLGRDDTPWYPTMRLFRQSNPGEWEPVIERVVTELEKFAASHPQLGVGGNIFFHSASRNEDGKPRFRMAAPKMLLKDPGIRFLVKRERNGTGYEYATRCFIDRHLEPGDLFIDVGAHWGIMSLQAATRWPGRVDCIAIEPLPANIPFLRDWIRRNKLEDRITIVAAAAGAKPGHGKLRVESTMGHSLVADDKGAIEVVTVDGLLEKRSGSANRRVIVKIDVEGGEFDVLSGMERLLASGQVRAIIWERGPDYDQAGGADRVNQIRDRFAALGFMAWRFVSEDDGGALVPFVENGTRGNVFELAPDTKPLSHYEAPRLSAGDQPADPSYDAMRDAFDLFQQGCVLQDTGKIDDALSLYASAAAHDQRMPDLYSNLGVALRQQGKLAASEAAYRRSVGMRPSDAGTLSNFGNLLRERGKFEEARQIHSRAVELKPNEPGIICNAALVERDSGHPQLAQREFERILALRPGDKECKWDLALSHLQQGNYAKGFPSYEARWGLKRSVARKSTLRRWDGSPLKGETIFLHDEQGFGDVLMFARFIPEVKRRGAKRIVVECQPELIRLMAMAPGVDVVVKRGAQAPDGCDLVAPLLSLPGLFGTTLETLHSKVPYLKAPIPEIPLPSDTRLKLGLAWAGKLSPRDRSCPLEALLPLLGDPRFSVFSFQLGPRASDIKALGAESVIFDLSPRLHDFAETAALLKQIDVLVTIDSAIAHLAGALGVRTFLMLRQVSDWRWFDDRDDSPWYPTMRLFRQRQFDEWSQPVKEIGEALCAIADRRTGR